MSEAPQHQQPAPKARNQFTPWLLGGLAFYTTVSILTSREPLLSAAALLPLWLLGFGIYHYLPQLRVAKLYFHEYHAYLRALDYGLLPTPEAEHLSAKARDSVDLTVGEQAEFERLMNDAGIKD